MLDVPTISATRGGSGFGLLTAACLLGAIVLGTGEGVAQRTVNVAQGFGTLNVAVFGDTLSNGQRVDTNTVYVLERGGIYILDGAIDHSFPLTMVGAPGPGALPRLILGVPSGGTAPDEPIMTRGNLVIRNLYVTCLDELGGLKLRIIRMRTPGMRVIVDSCWLDLAGQAAFRVDAGNSKLYITNTVISNIGTMDSPNNGRGIDDRGNDIDTIVSVNNTYYNLTSRALRDGGGRIIYAKFDHNTFHNLGQRVVTFGQALTAIFTNNLAINPSFLGSKALPDEALVNVRVDRDTTGPQTVHIAYNNFYLDTAIVSAYPDTVDPLVNFDSVAQSYIDAGGTGATIISEMVDLTDGPASPVDAVVDWYTDPTPPNPPLDTVDTPFDFAYPTGAGSYTAGYSGQPLGDLNWFDMALVNVGEVPELPSGFRLTGNYPNPFNPETFVRIEIPQASDVRLSVYTILGEEVTTLMRQQLEAGTYDVRWDGTTESGARVASGLYIARLEASGFVATTKMMLVK